MVRFSKYAFKISIYFGLKYPYPHLILIFLASTSEILGGPDIYKQFGDMINLTCVIKGTAAPPETIYWYHRGKVRYRNHLYSNTYNLCTNFIQVISYYSNRGGQGGVSIINDKGEITVSQLLIKGANKNDEVRRQYDLIFCLF